jgi:thymidylate kinase
MDRSNDILLEPGLLSMPPGLGENAPGTILPIGPLMRRLAEHLEADGISWAVLRQADGLPDHTRYDVDLLVRPRDRDAAIRILTECGAETGWRIAGRIHKAFYDCLLLARGSADGGFVFLPIDLFTALEHRGLRYLDTEEVLRGRVRLDNGFWTLPPGMQAAVTLLKELLPHAKLKENSRAPVQRQAAEDPERFRQALESAAGPEEAARLVDAVQQGAWTFSKVEADRLRAAIRRRSPIWRLGLLRSAWANFRHLLRPAAGRIVCLAGADGSGKTTLARGLFAQLYKQPFKACRYLHGNAVVLPRFRDIRAGLRRLVGRPAPANPAPAGEPPLKGMMEPVAAWKSVALALYYAVDWMLARPLLRRWRGQWTLVILDRSFYDFYFQLGHRRCPRVVLNLLSHLVPKPDLLLCIEDDPERIHARKPELMVEEIRIEQEILRELSSRLPFARRLDATGGIDAMVESGRTLILKHLLGEGEP